MTQYLPPGYKSCSDLVNERWILKKKFDNDPNTNPWETYVHSNTVNTHVNHIDVAIELMYTFFKCTGFMICLNEYWYFTSSLPTLLSYNTNGKIIKLCIKNLQLILNNFVALMFMIHDGIMAEFTTEYNKIIHARTLPVIYWKISPSVESSFFFFSNLKNSVISKLNPPPTTILLLALLTYCLFLSSFTISSAYFSIY